MYKFRTSCRACGYAAPTAPSGIKAAPSSEKLIPVFSLGVQPLANDFRQDGEEYSGYAPLEVLFCPRCTLAQLSVVVRPDILYRNYAYVTSPSQMMLDHFQKLAYDLADEMGHGIKDTQIVEIGSNDGRLLNMLRAEGAREVLGIDPAQNLAKIAREHDVPTLAEPFTRDLARSLSEHKPEPDIILARHVFCHVDDWQDFVAGLEVLAGKDTLIALEVPYVVDLLDRCEFDTIYHEHLSYLSIRAMVSLLSKTNLVLHHVIRYAIHGGAILLIIRRRDAAEPPHDSVGQFLDAEKITAETWQTVGANASGKITALKRIVMDATQTGKRVCGYGASAKSTVWINACGFSKKQIEFICDSTVQKLYRKTPGTDVPILPEDQAFVQCSDYAIMFAWNYEREILDKQKSFTNGGGKFIIPHPNVRIVP